MLPPAPPAAPPPSRPDVSGFVVAMIVGSLLFCMIIRCLIHVAHKFEWESKRPTGLIETGLAYTNTDVQSISRQRHHPSRESFDRAAASATQLAQGAPSPSLNGDADGTRAEADAVSGTAAALGAASGAASRARTTSFNASEAATRTDLGTASETEWKWLSPMFAQIMQSGDGGHGGGATRGSPAGASSSASSFVGRSGSPPRVHLPYAVTA